MTDQFALLTFLAGALGVAGVYSIISDLYLRDRSRLRQRVDDEFRQRQRVDALIEQSGLGLTVRRLLTLTGAAALALAVPAGLVWWCAPAAAAGALVGAAGPLLYVAVKRKARLEKLMAQLPDAFDLMARVIRAGQTMAQALQAVADEFDQPIAGEFAYCYEQQNLGLPPEVALRDLARRTGLLEIKIFVLALLVQQQTGGPLAELLDKLATVIRERFRIRGKIRALTAEGRLQAAILLLIPPAMLLFILVTNRKYGQVLMEYPGLLVGMFVLELLGALWIRKIVNFDF